MLCSNSDSLLCVKRTSVSVYFYALIVLGFFSIFQYFCGFCSLLLLFVDLRNKILQLCGSLPNHLHFVSKLLIITCARKLISN